MIGQTHDWSNTRPVKHISKCLAFNKADTDNINNNIKHENNENLRTYLNVNESIPPSRTLRLEKFESVSIEKNNLIENR